MSYIYIRGEYDWVTDIPETIKGRARMAGWVRIFREPVSIATYLFSVAPARISVAKKPLCWNLWKENAVTQESATLSSGQRFVGMPDRGQQWKHWRRGTHHQ